MSDLQKRYIINAYNIFEDKAKAINLGLNRFDDDTKSAFMSLYEAVDADVNVVDSNVEE